MHISEKDVRDFVKQTETRDKINSLAQEFFDSSGINKACVLSVKHGESMPQAIPNNQEFKFLGLNKESIFYFSHEPKKEANGLIKVVIQGVEILAELEHYGVSKSSKDYKAYLLCALEDGKLIPEGIHTFELLEYNGSIMGNDGRITFKFSVG